MGFVLPVHYRSVVSPFDVTRMALALRAKPFEELPRDWQSYAEGLVVTRVPIEKPPWEIARVSGPPRFYEPLRWDVMSADGKRFSGWQTGRE